MAQVTTSQRKRTAPTLTVTATWLSEDPHSLIRCHMAALCTITSQGRMTGYWVCGIFDGPHWKANLIGFRFVKENPDGSQGEMYDLPLAFERSCDCRDYCVWERPCKHVISARLLGLIA